MKTNLNLFFFLTLFACTASAQSSPRTNLVEVIDNCGYCSNFGVQATACVIDQNGLVKKIEYSVDHTTRTQMKKVTRNTVSPETLNHLKKLIVKAERSPREGTVMTGSGDLASFRINAYNNSEDRFEVEIYSSGHDVMTSHAARALARKSAGICGMGLKRLEWKYVQSKRPI